MDISLTGFIVALFAMVSIFMFAGIHMSSNSDDTRSATAVAIILAAIVFSIGLTISLFPALLNM